MTASHNDAILLIFDFNQILTDGRVDLNVMGRQKDR